jgi:hypothetical protein
VRAGSRQVIDVVAIVSENAFRPANGRLFVFMAIDGVFTPVLAKHSKSFLLIDCVSVSVDRMHRNFEPMRKQVEVWQRSELTDVRAKVVIYEAFVEGRLEAPKHLARTVHDLYFLCGAGIYVSLTSGPT